MFRPDVVSRLSADHEWLGDGSVLQQPESSLSSIEELSCRTSRTGETAWSKRGGKRRPAVSVSSGEDPEEDLAKQIAERDKIEEGLVCVFSVLEPCRTFSFRFEKG